MKNEKTIKLYVYVDGVNDVPFYGSDAGEYEAFILANGEQYTTSEGFVFNVRNVNEQIEIGYFRYDAKRMGGAPTITCTLMYEDCLDDFWSENVYAEFNGEKYFLKQTPTSSYSNESTMFKHDLELVSERVALDNVYFYDTVSDEAEGDDKPVSNSTKFVFHGDIHEFASRLGHSLAQSGLDYTVHVDTGVSSESLLISFENAFFSNAIQEAYNTYNIPYYFVGKEIHFGLAGNNIEGVLAYGVDDALLSITKSNANYKIVNRATGTGSSDNIPFYYPNNSPKGEITAEHSREGASVSVVNAERYANKVALDGVIKYEDFSITEASMTSEYGAYASGEEIFLNKITGSTTRDFNLTFFASNVGKLTLNLNYAIDKVRNPIKGSSLSSNVISCRFTVTLYKVRGESLVVAKSIESGSVEIPITSTGSYVARITMEFASKIPDNTLTCYYKLNYSFDEGLTGWTYEGKEIDLSDIGLSVSDAVTGDTITQRLVRYINTSDKLLPSVYRETNGAERFYNAINGEYTNEDGSDIVFANPYIAGRPKEHIITVEDIKPTIKETVVNGLRIDMFSEFAYDEDDNDETYEDEEGNVYFKHPYFYGKLRIMDFNLFDHAIEQQPMTISFTDGDCGACNFEIGVTEDYPQKNPVQVYEEDTLIDGVLHKKGSLKRDENGMVLAGVEGTQQKVTTFQESQQDTSKYEVWIALRKEEETYGILMPQSLHRPKACSEGKNDGDTFVILGINLPFSYIRNAEEKLEKEIIKYIKENNEEKFKFSITFSRIYFEENPDVLALLNENSSLKVSYNGRTYDLYVSSFSYTMSEGDVLPEIRVELDDTLQVTQNALQNAISEVKSQIGSVVRNVNSQMAMQRASYLQRQSDDEAYGNINFTKGIKFGEGGKVEILDNNSAKLTIEYLEVTKRATFTSLEIQEKTHVGGQILVTPASMTCGEVEELEDAYRCYFQTKGEDGSDEIFNQFAVGDQAICQTFNAWGSKYYWRLVTAIGEDYIDLSKTDYDEGSGVPSAGDKIIQMGNRNDAERQNAIVVAAYGEGSPYIIQYKGINSFDLSEDKVVTKLSPKGNILTGKVHMEMGSDGLEELQEFINLKDLAGTANTNASNAQNKASTAILVADNAQQSADTANRNALQASEAAGAASEKAEEAILKADTAQEGLNNMRVGGQNMLRNSGFTGDYLSEQLADESVLESATELYSSPFDHWTTNGATVQDSTESTSGKQVNLANGSLAQTLYYKVLSGAEYVLSFKAKGTGFQYSFGGRSGNVTLSSEFEYYAIVVSTVSTSTAFSLSNANCTICDLKLEKGNKTTAWSPSPLDNASDRAYYQSMKYLSDAITKGSTDFYGGLVASNTILLGNAGDDVLTKNTAGINGDLSDGVDDVAFWAGGTMTQASETIIKYLEDPTYQPTETELATMAKFVVTHGGRAILNDIILRGIVYATGGEFTGKVSIDAPNVNGRVLIDDNGLVYYGTRHADGSEYPRLSLGGTCEGASLVARTENAQNPFCVKAAIIAFGGEEGGEPAIVTTGDIACIKGELRVDKISTSDAECLTLGDSVQGLRTKTTVISSTYSSSSRRILTDLESSILVNLTSGTCYLRFPEDPLDGQEYVIDTKGAGINITSNNNIYSLQSGSSSGTSTFSGRGCLRYKYYAGAQLWTAAILASA